MRFKFRRSAVALLTVGCMVFLLYVLGRDDEHFTDNNIRQRRSDEDITKDVISKNDFEEKVKQINIARNKVVKKDWHDYKAIEADRLRTGPGEQGAPVALLRGEETKSAVIANGFNILVSNRVSLNRSLSDIRHPNCLKRKYLADLPTASIIIPFHNEGWSTLFRTLHSIINRSPPTLLHEIILVDDCSTQGHLKQKLDAELLKYPKVKLLRLPQREGLIRARLAGVNVATGDVIIILDSHIEATHNWLPPLLEPIALDRKVLTCPMIDIIKNDKFNYLTQPGDAMRGAFDWELYYKRIPIPPDKQLEDPSDPFEDPVMAGGLFAIDRLYFKEIGQYDAGLEIWGGEQYELSFKAWMCGGKILDAPCSRVGHIYREFMPYSLPKGTNINKNFKRVAEVWMDEYKEYFYNKRPHVRHIDPGDLSKQKKLREDLQCKSFDWFMNEIAPDLLKHYPPIVPSPAAWGTLYNEGSGLCLDSMYRRQGETVTASQCNPRNLAEQEFLLTYKEDIRPGTSMESVRKVCIDGQGLNKPIVLWECHGQYGNQLWKYLVDKRQLYHGYTGLCATAHEEGVTVNLLPCDNLNKYQRWTWKNTDVQLLVKFNRNPNSPA
ncbi:polypeptide N-acetylgalactosaminyltransferase 10-like [Clavelina lepadiformis]|uniref:polypeptide N-acetylgalactosaminyltransferase 10-like n=1 Tax=Clavelina lepadiformis TaxID=159417 RepID=UPI00404235E1